MWPATDRVPAIRGLVLGGFTIYYAFLAIGSNWAGHAVRDLKRIQDQRMEELEQVSRSWPLEPSLQEPIEPLLLPQSPVTHRLDDRPGV